MGKPDVFGNGRQTQYYFKRIIGGNAVTLRNQIEREVEK